MRVRYVRITAEKPLRGIRVVLLNERNVRGIGWTTKHFWRALAVRTK